MAYFLVKTTTPFGTHKSEVKQYYDTDSNIVKKSIADQVDESGAEKTYTDILYSYDSMGNLIGETSGNGADTSVVQYWYDNANRVTAVQSGLSSINPSAPVPASGAVTKYEYDVMGYVSKETDALGQSS